MSRRAPASPSGGAWHESGTVDRLLKAARHPLRALMVALAVTSVVATFAGGAGVLAAVGGALAGLILGEALGAARRVRLGAALAGLAVGGVVGLMVARGVVAFALVPRLIGVGAALRVREAVGLIALAGPAIAALRLVSVRRPAWRFVELALLALLFAVSFASHRGGSIARPLWLSDLAWRAGYDPSAILIGVGVAFGLVGTALLLMESRHRLSIATALGLPLLGLLLLLNVDPRALQPDPAEALEAIHEALPTGGSREIDQSIPVTIGHGDPPKPTGPGVLQGPGEGDGDGVAEGDGGDRSGDRPGDGGGGAEGDADGAEGGTPQEGGAAGGTPEDGSSEGGSSQDSSSEGGTPQDGSSDGGSPQDGSSDGGSPQDGSSEGGDPQDGSSAGGSPPPEGEGEGEGGAPPEVANQPEMEFDGGETGQGSAPAAVVVFRDDYRTPSGYYYFRQQAHSQFNGHRMVPTTRDDADLDIAWTFPTRIEPVAEPPPWPLRARVRGRVALLGEHDGPFALETAALYLPSTNPNPDRFVGVYRFESYAQETPYDQLVGRVAGDPDWSQELRDYYLTAPGDPRYQALVDEILAPLPEHARSDPFTRALAIKVYLDENMKYSLSRAYPDRDDPTADFLFGDLVGYCVHSAHAAAYLWRLAGIPARVGTGYLVDESARRGSSLIVMGADAHAWPELYLDGVGWIPMDITPAENLDPPGQPVDSDMTSMLGEMVRAAEDIEEAEEPPLPLGLWLRRLALAAAAVLGLTTLGALYLTKAWRRARPVLCTRRQLPRVGYRAALDRLAEAGWAREEGETREAFARRVAGFAPSFTAITDLHVAAALADPARTDPPERSPARWRAALAAFADELPAAAPWWRRWLGLLDPTSFFRAR